ncbi:MAG: transposase [Pseudomonadales bacterium]|nr:transposase [Pseudomonadales bacterium]
MPVHAYRLSLYGKEQHIRLRSTIAVVRFLKGAPVRALWCQFFDPDKDAWTKPRLLLASELDLGALDVVHIYARRWGIEPLFHNLNRWWGVSNLWQQSQAALELWMQIRSTAWVLAQLLTLVVAKAFPIHDVAPWRTGHALTAGLVAQWMRIEFTGLAFRDGFNQKSQKFSFPAPRNDPRMHDGAGQSP